jgi:hypothetical protein
LAEAANARVAAMICYDLGEMAQFVAHNSINIEESVMARKPPAAPIPSTRPQSGEIALLIAASQFVREAGGWRAAEGHLRAVQDFVNACGGFDKAQQMLGSLEAIRGNLDGLAAPEPRDKERVETVE